MKVNKEDGDVSQLTIREALNIDRTKETSAAVDEILSRIVGMGISVDTPFLEMQEADYQKTGSKTPSF
jgi:hypothetical protein